MHHDDRPKLEECINPKNWELLLQDVRKVAGHNIESNMYRTSSLSLKLGYTLSKCAKLMKSEAIIQDDAEKKKEC